MQIRPRHLTAMLAAGLTLAATTVAFGFVAPPDEAVRPNYDSRDAVARTAPAALASVERALTTRLGVAVRMTTATVTGTPASLMPMNPASWLTPPSSDDAESVARRFLGDNGDVFKLSAAEVQSLVLETRYDTRDRGWTHLWFQQTVDGVPVYGGRIGVHLGAESRILEVVAGPYVAGLSGRARPVLAAGQAVALAADLVHESFLAGEEIALLEESAPGQFVFGRGHFLSPITARVVWFPTAAGARLAWHVVVDSSQYPAVYEQMIDAETGVLLMRHNLTQYAETAQYYPIHPTATPARQTISLTAASHPSSPLGWVNAGSPVTISNNVVAHEDPGTPTNGCGTQGPIFSFLR